MVRQQKNEELMAAGVTLIDPATTYVDADVVVGPDTVIHPCVFLEGSTKIGSACEIHAGTRIVNSTVGDRVCVRNHTVVTDATIAAGRDPRPVCAHSPGIESGRGGARRQLRRVEEDRDGEGRQGESPCLSRRCDDWRRHQCGGRHHHLQLRWREEAPDHHRQGRLRRQQQHAGGAGYLGRWIVHCSRLCSHYGCAGWRARHRPCPPGKQRRLGRETAKGKRAKNYVRDHWLYRAEAGRAGHSRWAAAARVSRLRLGGRGRCAERRH